MGVWPVRGWWLDTAIVAVAALSGAASIVLAPPSGAQAALWALVGMAALALGLVRRLPVVVVAIEVVLVVVIDVAVPAGSHVAVLAAAIALGAVAYRHRWPITLLSLAATYAAILIAVGRDAGDLLTGANGLVRMVSFALAVSAPVAFGRYLAAVRQAAVVAEERAREAEERRLVDTRTARLAEGTRIAGDLHDLVAHHVSAIALRAASGQYAATHAPETQRLGEAVSALQSIHTSARQALIDLRGLLRILRDPGNHQSTVDPRRIIDEAVQRSRSAGLDVVARVDDRTTDMPLTLRVTVARVVQEALTNAIKHAGPGTEVEATVGVHDSRLYVEVANSVPGGRQPALPVSGHGIAGMRERVEILGGTLTAGPTDTGGWRLYVTLPIAVPG
jgi:signal transduction histidine kinase